MPAPLHDWDNVDKKLWGKMPDTIVAEEYNVDKSVIAYWRVKYSIPSYDEYFLKIRSDMFSYGFGWCSKCEKFLPIELFGKYKKDKFGIRTHCKNCRRVYRSDNREEISKRNKKRYEDNKEKYAEMSKKWRNKNKAKIKLYMKERHHSAKLEFVNLAGGECQRCGYSEFLSGLDFHHVIPEEKEANPVAVIANGNYVLTYKELDKCALLCKCCHQSFHTGDWECEFVKDEFGWKIKK